MSFISENCNNKLIECEADSDDGVIENEQFVQEAKNSSKTTQNKILNKTIYHS